MLRALDEAVRAGELGKVVPGPVTVHLHDELVVEPDIVFVLRQRMAIVDREGGIHGPPDLVVEVLSPSNRAYDRDLKRKRYLESGVPEVWIVDADTATVEVWKAGRAGALHSGGTLQWTVGKETLRLDLAEVFA